jgi:PAS domain S-box-containing protein
MEERPTIEQIFNATSNGLIATDTEGRIITVNEQACKIVDMTRDELLDRNISDLLPLTGPLVMKCLQTGRLQLGKQIFDKNLDLVVDITPIRENGKIRGAVSSFQKMRQFEYTAKKLESYKKLIQQLEAIFASSSDGLWVCDGNGKVIKINKASEKLNGVKLKDVVGKKSQQMIREGVIDRSAVLEVLSTKRKVIIMQHLPKTKKYVLVTATPVFDKKGNIFLIVLNERDLTQLNIASKKLEQARMISERYKDELLQLRMLELKDQAFIAKDNKMKQVLDAILKLARMEASNILIMGESGTGKGLLAKMFHENSNWRKNPFIQINCAALPENLLEAELFGYEKGAFTGASEQGKVGLFELAHNGTLFLDEIGDMPLSVQVKLLKYLDDHEILRLGGIKSKKINCKIIAATNRDLETQVRKKRFREDLFYRLNTFTIKIPPLRERIEDVLEHVNHFLSEFNKTYQSKKRISVKGFEFLKTYHFPGNVRELKNFIKQAVVFSEADLLDDFIFEKLQQSSQKLGVSFEEKKGRVNLTDNITAVERELLKSAISKCNSTQEVADYLGISQPTAFRKLKKHGLTVNSSHQ